MQQQAMQQQAMQQAMQQQAMQQRAMQPQMQPQMHPQMTPQLQQQLHQQLINQQMQQQMTPQIIERMQQQALQQQQQISKTNGLDVNSIMFSNRDSLVLLLLYLILLTPQVNSIMNKIPYTSDEGNYPSYLGILLRGLIFIGAYISMKNLNLI